MILLHITRRIATDTGVPDIGYGIHYRPRERTIANTSDRRFA